MKLNDPTLLQQLAYIDGQWVPADSGATLPVTNPATGALLRSDPCAAIAEMLDAIGALAGSVVPTATRPAGPRAIAA